MSGTELPQSGKPASQSKGWTVRISSELDLTAISPYRLSVLVALERLCRNKAFTWVSNSSLAKATGISRRQVQIVLGELESSGFIHRISAPNQPGNPRAGIGLLRRLDASLAAYDGSKSPATPAHNLRTPRAAHAHPPRKSCAPPPRTICAQNKDEVIVVVKDELNKDALKNDARGDRSSKALQRQRPEAERPPATTRPPADGQPLTPAQQEFLASIPVELKPNWDAASPANRARMLAIHAERFVRPLAIRN